MCCNLFPKYRLAAYRLVSRRLVRLDGSRVEVRRRMDGLDIRRVTRAVSARVGWMCCYLVRPTARGLGTGVMSGTGTGRKGRNTMALTASEELDLYVGARPQHACGMQHLHPPSPVPRPPSPNPSTPGPRPPSRPTLGPSHFGSLDPGDRRWSVDRGVSASMAPSIRWDLLSDLSCVDRTPVSGMKQRLRVSSTRRGNPIAGSAAPDGRSHPGTVTRAKRAGMMLTCRWSPASMPCPGPLKAYRRTGRRKCRNADSKHPCFLGAWVILGEQWRPAGRAGRIWGSVSMPQGPGAVSARASNPHHPSPAFLRTCPCVAAW